MQVLKEVNHKNVVQGTCHLGCQDSWLMEPLSPCLHPPFKDLMGMTLTMFCKNQG